jgi:hypothetical protein
MNTTTETFDTTPLLEELTRKEAEANDALLAVKAANRRHKKARDKVRDIRLLLADPTSALVSVSDHAVLRYAERALGLNTEEIRATIRQKVAPLSNVLGDGKYPVNQQSVAVVQGGCVVTVLAVE